MKATAAEPAWGGLVSESVVRVKNTLNNTNSTIRKPKTRKCARSALECHAAHPTTRKYGAHPSPKIGGQQRIRRPKQKASASRGRRESIKSAKDDELRPRGRKIVRTGTGRPVRGSVPNRRSHRQVAITIQKKDLIGYLHGQFAHGGTRRDRVRFFFLNSIFDTHVYFGKNVPRSRI